MGAHKKEQKIKNLEKEKQREEQAKYDEFWSNNVLAIPILEKQYPNIPRPLLELNLRMYNKVRKMSKEDRKKWEDELENMPEKPNLTDFKLEGEVYEDCIKIIKNENVEEFNEIKPIEEEPVEIIENSCGDIANNINNTCEIL